MLTRSRVKKGVLSRAVFLDRDGTLCECDDGQYIHTWSDVCWIPGVLDSLAYLHREAPDLKTFIVTNQAGIARKYTTRGDVRDTLERMAVRISECGGRIDGWIFCPHDIDAGCSCRKPKPGMLDTLAYQFDIDLSESYLVGDWLTDIQAGQARRLKTILVRTGRGEKALKTVEIRARSPSFIALDVGEAISWILDQERKG